VGSGQTVAGELDRERWPEQHHIVVAEQGGVLERGVGRGNLIEERFYLACWREGDDHLPGAVTDTGPDMRDVSGSEDRVSGMEVVTLAADFRDVVSLEYVEQLVLMRMQMEGRAATLVHVMLRHEQGAMRVLCEDFESQGAEAHRMQFTGAVLFRKNGVGELRWR
jgi:hypothetical protein